MRVSEEEIADDYPAPQVCQWGIQAVPSGLGRSGGLRIAPLPAVPTTALHCIVRLCFETQTWCPVSSWQAYRKEEEETDELLLFDEVRAE